MCYGQAGAIWGLLESISGSPWWAGWQRLGVVPAGPREALTQHECPGCTPCPLLMNQLSHSTEKLTQTHRQKVTVRRTPGAESAGHSHPYPALGFQLQPLPEEHLCPHPGLPGGSHLPVSPCLPSVGLRAHASSVLPGLIDQVLIGPLGCLRSAWARGRHTMTHTGFNSQEA